MKKQIYSEQEPVCEYTECTAHNKFISKAQILSNDIENILSIPASSTNLLKACHYCYTYYCSSMCRELHWPEHKRTKCYYGHLASQCKKTLTKIGRSRQLRNELSIIASSSYSNTNKPGFVWINFKTVEEADQFVEGLNTQISEYFHDLVPKYVAYDNLSIVHELFNRKEAGEITLEELKEFDRLCTSYNPQQELILLVSIQIESQVRIIILLNTWEPLNITFDYF